jgi:hypothetical protein
MRLESLQVFDQAGWDRVHADLEAQGRTFAMADADRRMQSAMGRQELHIGTDLGFPGSEIHLTLVPTSWHADWYEVLQRNSWRDFCGVDVAAEPGPAQDCHACQRYRLEQAQQDLIKKAGEDIRLIVQRVSTETEK